MNKITIKLPEEILQTFNEALLYEDKKVRLLGIGTFELRKIKSRKLFHNFSNKVITIPKYKKIHFTPSLTIKNKI